MRTENVSAQAARALLTASAVRRRCAEVFEHVRAERSRELELDEARMDRVVETTARVIRRRFPGLDIPPHSRWRHFQTGGIDRWSLLQAERGGWSSRLERLAAELDLTVISVLLDAGAGPGWRFPDPFGKAALARSEGLAVASLLAFTAGIFSSRGSEPWRADAQALQGLRPEALAARFAVDQAHPLAGLTERALLLNRLGAVLGARGDGTRPSQIITERFVSSGRVAAGRLLETILLELGPIWPEGERLGGLALGDTWRHPAVQRRDGTGELVPFHKLSQWLTYSLIEPLERAGIRVCRLEELTGLAEYRNGGLFVDLGVIRPRSAGAFERRWTPGETLVVEWRACTVSLLDRLAPLLRRRLGAGGLSLAQLLEGGTWAAGREAARQRRCGAAPPIDVDTGGTVF